MAHSVVAYQESIDPAGSQSNISAVTDDIVTTEDDNLFIPSETPFLLGSAGFLGAEGTGTAGDTYELQAPSLRDIANPRYSKDSDTKPDGDEQHEFNPANPVQLDPQEGMEALIDGDYENASNAAVVVFLSDGAISPVTGRQIYTVRASASINSTIGEWTSGNLDFEDNLPNQEYDILGMRVVGDGIVAARLIFRGKTPRPGVVPVPSEDSQEAGYARNGNAGIFGTFTPREEPQLEVLANDSNSNQTVYFDIAPTGS